MKIGFVLDDRLDKPDGVQQYVKLVASWMAAHGHTVHYLVGESPNATEKNVHGLSRTVGVKFNKNRMAIPLPASKKKITELIAREQFDVLHVQMPYSPLLAGRVVKAASANTAVIGTFHILPHGALSSAGTRLLGAFLTKNKRRFDGFLSVSKAAQEFSASHFGISSTVMPNVVDLAKFQKGLPLKAYADKKNIVFLGRLVERKGAPHLLRAFELLVTKDPEMAKNVRLIICGDGEERQQLEADAQRITRTTKAEILFTGFLDEDDKPDYLASAHVAVYPSTGGESFGIVLIEAMAARSHVVLAGNNPGYSSVLASVPQVLFDPSDRVGLSTLLSRSLNDVGFSNLVFAAQQELVKDFDLKFVGPKIEAYYKAVLAKRNHSGDTILYV